MREGCGGVTCPIKEQTGWALFDWLPWHKPATAATRQLQRLPRTQQTRFTAATSSKFTLAFQLGGISHPVFFVHHNYQPDEAPTLASQYTQFLRDPRPPLKYNTWSALLQAFGIFSKPPVGNALISIFGPEIQPNHADTTFDYPPAST
jgi:hypothetical protein